MQGLSEFRETMLRTLKWGVLRSGTLLAAAAMVTLTTGCPTTAPGPGTVGGACLEDGTCTQSDNFCDAAVDCVEGTCAMGATPCPEGETCNEDADRCEDCQMAADCTDPDEACTDPACTDGRCENVAIVCEVEGQTCVEPDGCADLCDGVVCSDDPCLNESCDIETGECVGDPVVCDVEGETCNSDTGECEDLCADVTCSDDACLNESCDTATGDCVGDPVECAADEVCEDGTCVAAGLRVSIDNCPTEDQNGGSTVALTATVTGASEGGQVTFAWSSDGGGTFDDATTATTNLTLPNSGTVTVTVVVTDNDVTPGTDVVVSTDVCATDAECTTAGDVCNTDLVCETPATADVLTATGTATSEGCIITITFTEEIICNAGTVTPRRSAVGGFAGVALTGTATQAGVTTIGVLVPTWTVMSQPAGTGAISFSNDGLLTPTFTVAAPGSAGTYEFLLTVNNNGTGQSCTSTASMEVLDGPLLQMQGSAVARRNVQHGNTIMLPLEYQCSETTTYSVYAKQGLVTTDTDQVLLAEFTVAPSPDAFTQMDVNIDTSILAEGAGTYDIGWEALDAVGFTQTGGTPTQLAINAGDEVIVNRRNVAIAVGAARTNGQILAITTGTSATNPAEPTGLNLDTQVGAPVGFGNGRAADAFSATNVIYPGLAPRAADVGALTHRADTMNFGKDFNGDGLNDIVYAEGNSIEILFGSVATTTNGAAYIGDAALGGTVADATAAGNQDWQAAGAFTASVRTRIAANAAVDDDIEALTCGDYNNDGNMDLAYVGDDVDGGAVCGFVFTAGNASNADPSTNSVGLIYTANTRATDANTSCDSGDFNGDGIMDVTFGLGDEDPSAAADAVSANTEGAIAIVYGKVDTGSTLGSAFPVTGRVAATFAADADGFYATGTAAANTLYGLNVHMGDVTGTTSDDVIFQRGAATLSVIAGSTGDQADPGGADFGTFNITPVTAADFGTGTLDIAVGNLTGGTKNDLVVGAPLANTTTSASAVDEGIVYVVPGANLASAAINTLTGIYSIRNSRAPADDNDLGLGTGVAVFDWNGDGTMDLLVGHDGDATAPFETIYVKHGPLSGTGANFNNSQNGFDFRLEANAATTFTGIEGFAYADVNGDGISDVLVITTDSLGCIAGLE